LHYKGWPGFCFSLAKNRTSDGKRFMNTTATILLLCGAIYWLFRPREDRSLRNRRRSRWSNPYPAASVSHRQDACSAVQALADTRFLAWEAPSIPVPGCTAQQCQCRYLYHPDRRAPGAERRSDEGAQAVERGFDRRHGKDRRTGARETTPGTLPARLQSPGMSRP
jgi:hypothetical protein